MSSADIRPGEIDIPTPASFDAGLYFIGVIRTPWLHRHDCPRRGGADGPECTIELDPRWEAALQGLASPGRIQVLYWMHLSRRDLVVQVPGSRGQAFGTFALRSPVRPNPIASSMVQLLAIKHCTLTVRGLDCIDGTPLLDLKPEHGAAQA
jgi:tRNA-Thr(GGU) m(6)t(6)A37 methyltransferase TsaA